MHPKHVQPAPPQGRGRLRRWDVLVAVLAIPMFSPIVDAASF